MKLTEQEKIRIAEMSQYKNLDYESLYYSDYMNGHESETDDVWDYVAEMEEIGTIAFKEKYK